MDVNYYYQSWLFSKNVPVFDFVETAIDMYEYLLGRPICPRNLHLHECRMQILVGKDASSSPLSTLETRDFTLGKRHARLGAISTTLPTHPRISIQTSSRGPDGLLELRSPVTCGMIFSLKIAHILSRPTLIVPISDKGKPTKQSLHRVTPV